MASPPSPEATPPPVIGKAGRLTIFITPPPTPRLSESPRSMIATPIREMASPLTEKAPPAPAVTPPPPVQVPPQQFKKPAARSSDSVFGFFWGAVTKVQNVHSSLDEYLADWFGLNQSKYQWALDDFYENNGKGKDGTKGCKTKEASKEQAV